jgi:hypothetical protein
MPIEKTKQRIIQILNTERNRLEKNLVHLQPGEMINPNVIGIWSVKDVLAHLADWEAHMPTWIEAARSGDPVLEIEEGLNWKQFPEFNQRIYERHCNRSLNDVLEYFRNTHRAFMTMVTTMPEEEMLEPGRYRFIGKGAVYDWLNAYAGHDRWAKTHIRKWISQRG